MTVITSTNADTEFSKSFPYRDRQSASKKIESYMLSGYGACPVLQCWYEFFFSVLNLRLMKELKRYSYDHFLDILSVADIYQPNPFGDISTNVYNLLKSVVIEVITSQIKKRE